MLFERIISNAVTKGVVSYKKKCLNGSNSAVIQLLFSYLKILGLILYITACLSWVL